MLALGGFLALSWQRADQERTQDWQLGLTPVSAGSVDGPADSSWTTLNIWDTWGVWVDAERSIGRCALEKANGSPGVWLGDRSRQTRMAGMWPAGAFSLGDNQTDATASTATVRLTCNGASGPVFAGRVPDATIIYFVSRPFVVPAGLVLGIAFLATIGLAIWTARRRPTTLQ